MGSEASVGLRVYLQDEFSEGLAVLSDMLNNLTRQAQTFGQAFSEAMNTAAQSAKTATDATAEATQATQDMGESTAQAAAETETAAESMSNLGVTVQTTSNEVGNFSTELVVLQEELNSVLTYGTDLISVFDGAGGAFGGFGTIITEVSDELPLLGQSMALVVADSNSLATSTNALIGPFDNLNNVVDGFVVSVTEVVDEVPLLTAAMGSMTESTGAAGAAMSSLDGSFYEDAGILTTLQERYVATEEAVQGVESVVSQLSAVGASNNNTLNASATAFANVGTQAGTASTGVAGMSGSVGTLMAMMMAATVAVQGINALSSGAMGLQSTLTQVGLASGATGKSLDLLDGAVIKIADSSKFTTAEVGAAFALIMERGYSATDTVQHLGQAVVNLAEATGSDLNPSAVLLSSTMQTFGAKASDAERYASALTFAFYHGIPSVTEMQTAMEQVGGTAAVLHIPIEQVAATLDYLVQQGLSASTAGSSLRYMLQGLTDPTSKAAEELANLGIITVHASSSFDILVAKTDAAAKAAHNTPAAFDGTLASMNAIFTQGKKLGTIHTDQTFYQWALSAGYLKDSLYNAQGVFVGLPSMIQQIGNSIKGLPDDQKLAALQQLFNIKGGQGGMHLLDDIQKSFPELTKLINQMEQAEKNDQAAAYAKKVMQDAGNQLQALKTTVGSALQEAFLPTVQAVGNLASKINDMIGPLTSAQGPAHDFFSAFLPLLAAGGLIALVVAFSGLLAPIVGISLVIGGVAAGFALFYTAIKSGNPFFILLMSTIAAIALWIGTAFIPELIAMAAGFFGAAAGAWALMAPFLPAIAVILAVAGVIALIILAVQHWGQIAHWLQGIWSNVIGWLSGVWKGVQAVWSVTMNAIGNFLKGLWSGIVNILSFYIHMMVAYFMLPVTAMKWFYDHNYYVKDAVDWIVNAFKFLGQKVQELWSGFLGIIQAGMNWLKMAWGHIAQGIHDDLVVPFQALMGLINSIVQGGLKWVGDRFNQFTSWIGSWAPGVLKNVGQGFSNFGGFLHDHIVKPVDDLGNLMLQSGKNFMQMLANGIAAGAGWVWDGIKNIAAGIWKNLGFHSPTKEGILSESDEWMPNMMKMFAGGITSNTHLVTNAVTGVAAGIHAGIQTPTIARLQGASSASSSAQQNTTINLNVDGKTVGTAVFNHLTGQMQLNGLNRAWR